MARVDNTEAKCTEVFEQSANDAMSSFAKKQFSTFTHEISNEQNIDSEIASKSLDAIYVFISFDLTNSTLFKNRHMEMWPGFITSFYNTVMDQFSLKQYTKSRDSDFFYSGGFLLWKLVGDEVLLYHKVYSKEELYKAIIEIDNKRQKLVEKTIEEYINTFLPIKNTKEGPTQEMSANGDGETDITRKRIQTKQTLSRYFQVKTTVWIGSCTDAENKIDIRYPNLIYNINKLSNEYSKNDNQMDFLGPDIDEGFRLCAHSEKGQMIISPKLAYLLLLAFDDDVDKKCNFITNFKIVDYVTMKGVWEDRLYPIIMFCQRNPDNTIELEQWKNMFEYDAFEKSALYQNIEKNGEAFLQDSKFSILNLKKIYEDIVREDEMQEMLRILKEQESKKDYTLHIDPRFEFHISCLCHRDGQFWVTQHRMHGWSFGCTKVEHNENYLEHVKEMYEKKYGLDISENSNILSFYSVERKIDLDKNEESELKTIPPSTIILGVVVLVNATEIFPHCENENNNAILEKGEWKTYEEALAIEDHRLKNFQEILQKAHNILSPSTK